MSNMHIVVWCFCTSCTIQINSRQRQQQKKKLMQTPNSALWMRLITIFGNNAILFKKRVLKNEEVDVIPSLDCYGLSQYILYLLIEKFSELIFQIENINNFILGKYSDIFLFLFGLLKNKINIPICFIISDLIFVKHTLNKN